MATATSHCDAEYDVRAHNPGKSDMEIKEVHAYGAGLRSMSSIIGLSNFTNLMSLCLHGNRISAIEGLESLHNLENLNLSSNCIKKIERLSHLSNLRALDLSSNLIEELHGLEGLNSLVRLALAHNDIEKLRGLAAQDGPGYTLQFLDLRGNKICSLSELWFLARCINLQELLLSRGRQSNGVCRESAYISTVLSVLPHLQLLDGRLLLPPQFSDFDKCSRYANIGRTCKIPFQLNAEQLLGSLSRAFEPASPQNHMLTVYTPTGHTNFDSLQQQNAFLKALQSWSQRLANSVPLKVHTKDGMCSPRLPKDHPLLSQSEGQLHNALSGVLAEVQGVKYSQAELQEAKSLNVHLQDLPWSTREVKSLEDCNSTCSQVDHDLIGFYKKKNTLIRKMDVLTEEQWNRLNSFEARLKILEECAVKCAKRVNSVKDRDAIPSSMDNQCKEIEHDNKGQRNANDTLLVPSTGAENQGNTDIMNVVEHDITKGLAVENKVKTLGAAWNEGPSSKPAITEDKTFPSFSAKKSACTQTDICNECDTEFTFLEEQVNQEGDNADGKFCEAEAKSNNNLKDHVLHTEKKFRKQEICFKTPKDEKIFHLKTEIKADSDGR